VVVESNDVLLEVRGIVKEFGSVTALNKVDLEVRCGEVLGLIGENGSGKSTLTSIIAGIQPPTSGEMIFTARGGGQPLETSFDGRCTFQRHRHDSPGKWCNNRH
jgi:ribose transport system ATP-binding protein